MRNAQFVSWIIRGDGVNGDRGVTKYHLREREEAGGDGGGWVAEKTVCGLKIGKRKGLSTGEKWPDHRCRRCVKVASAHNASIFIEGEVT